MTKGKLIKNLSIKIAVHHTTEQDKTGRKVIVIDEDQIVAEFNQQLDNIIEMFHQQNADAE